MIVPHIGNMDRSKAAMQTTLCRIIGIFTQQGKTRIRNELLRLSGVQVVEIDVDKSTVRVLYHAPATDYDIMRSIEAIGFTVERLPSS